MDKFRDRGQDVAAEADFYANQTLRKFQEKPEAIIPFSAIGTRGIDMPGFLKEETFTPTMGRLRQLAESKGIELGLVVIGDKDRN